MGDWFVKIAWICGLMKLEWQSISMRCIYFILFGCAAIQVWLSSGGCTEVMLCFRNSCQLQLCLWLSCDISVNKLHSKMHNSWLPYHLCPSVHLDISMRLSELLSSHTLCQYYLVIISGYQLGLFTLHFNPQLCISWYRHAQNDLYYLSHAYSMSHNLPVVIFHVLVCLNQFWISTQLLQLVSRT